MGACDCFTHSVLGLHLFWTCMCRPCIYCYNLWFHLCISPDVFISHCFLGVIYLVYRVVVSICSHVWTWANLSVHIYLEVRDQHQPSFSNIPSFLRQGLSLNMNPMFIGFQGPGIHLDPHTQSWDHRCLALCWLSHLPSSLKFYFWISHPSL